MDPPTLVLGGNTTRYLCLAFGTGWKGAPRVTSNGKVNGGRSANVSRTVCWQFFSYVRKLNADSSDVLKS